MSDPLRSRDRPWIPPLVILLLAGFLLAPSRATPWPAEGWEREEAEHASLFFRSRDRRVADQVKDDLEWAFQSVSRNLGIRTDLHMTVYLASSPEEFRELTAGAVPDWGVGCALPAHRAIVLRKDPRVSRGLRETVAHEVSHVLLRSVTGDERVPIWFDEGVAMWNASEWRWVESYEMTAAAAFGNLLPLLDIDDVLAFSSPKAHLAYAESFSAVSYLIDGAGPGAISRILADLHAGRSFEEAFTECAGMPSEAFQAKWMEEVKRKFGLTSLVAGSLNFWLGVTFLFLLAYIATKLRNRRTIRRWVADEEGPALPRLQVHVSSGPESDKAPAGSSSETKEWS